MVQQSYYQRVYRLVRMIPTGQVATYGSIARSLSGVNARMVGYAMAATPEGSGIPWHRVINSQGKISSRHTGDGPLRQRTLLEQESVFFNEKGRIDLEICGWNPPPMEWIDK